MFDAEISVGSAGMEASWVLEKLEVTNYLRFFFAREYDGIKACAWNPSQLPSLGTSY
jgi:hypothetical protein